MGDGALTCRVECTHAKARQRDLDFTTAAIILKSAHLLLYSLCRLGGLSLHARRRRSIMYTPLDRERTQQAPARANVRGCHELLRPCMQRILPTIHGIISLCLYYHHITPPVTGGGSCFHIFTLLSWSPAPPQQCKYVKTGTKMQACGVGLRGLG